MNVEILSRLQFAFTAAFHYLYPPLSIGLGVILVMMEGAWLKTRNPVFHNMARFWTKIFALIFGLGVATGIVLEFEFGTNWATYSTFRGDIFGSALAAIGMTATTASDPSGVEYYFEQTSGNPGGDDSGWQDSPTYTDSGLDSGTEYTYRVRARDKSPAHAANNWSPEASATTDVPDTTAPMAISLSPSNGASNVPVNTALVITFDEEITLGTGLITIKNLTDATQSTIDITDGTQVSATGAALTIDPTANLGYGKHYAIQIAATAIDDLAGNSYGGILDDTTWAFTTAAEPAGPGGAVIYEPFEDSNSSLAGNTPGTGPSGTWSSNGASVVAGSLAYGSLPAGTGNEVSASNHYGGVSVGSTLSEAGLLNDGASLWFSVLVQTGSDIATNGDLGFALGTERIGSGNNIPVANSGQALGFTFKNNQLRASLWGPGTLTRSSTNSGNGASPNTLYLVAGKFTWGAASDTIEIYKVSTDLTLGSAVSSYTTPSNLDQTLFDTLSFGTKSASPAHFIDEIRLGATYEDVIGQGGSGPGPLDHFAISPIGSPQTVGTPITGITLTAQDASDQTVANFTGTVTFGGTGGFSGTSVSFTAGVLTGVSVTPTAAGGNLTLTVTGSGKTGSTTVATIDPAPSAYETWSGGAAFDADANGDGVDNGPAWLLGASNKDENALSKLPVASPGGGNLVLNFTCLKVANRGGAVLKVQSSNDLGITDPWTSHEAEVPDANGTVNGVVFVTGANAKPDLIDVQATIPGSPGTKLFGRLSAVNPPPRDVTTGSNE